VRLTEKAENVVVDLAAAGVVVVVAGRVDLTVGWGVMLYLREEFGKRQRKMILGRVCEYPSSRVLTVVVGLLMSRVSQFHLEEDSRMAWSPTRSMVYHLLGPRLGRYRMPSRLRISR
jgi:hypothetical protein